MIVSTKKDQQSGRKQFLNLKKNLDVRQIQF